MSKERELLRKVVAVAKGALVDEIKELLAQPEPEQEPVAWMYERQSKSFTERTLSVGFEKDFDGITTPLYASTPKREPLSEDEIKELWVNKSPINEFECVRLVEKAHGIGVDDE